MSPRSIAAIVMAIIVAVEIFFLINTPIPTKWEGEAWRSAEVVDSEVQKNTQFKYGIILGATILAGGIVTFTLPGTKTKKEKD